MESLPVRRPNASLAQLHRLEWRYDGPVPAAALSTLEATPGELARRQATADAAVLDGLAHAAVRSLAAARRRMPFAELPQLDQHGAVARLIGCRRDGLATREAIFPPP